MDDRVREAIFRRVAEEPFAQKFGLKLLALDDGHSRVEMRFTPDMENLFGMAHGGALFALVDEAFETASNSHGTMAVALSMNVAYLASPRPGALLTAEAKELNRSNRTAVYEIRVEDEDGRLLVSCQALVYRMAKPLPFLTDTAPPRPEP
ncbi:MAG: PaaI family thioesterase [Syntrophales bacterium]|nr:PaaI family thioesterase [Syntrophales bacterium]MDD4339441.1 hotdog fold thioesterase [Syntrophales bacterium]HOG07426.1 hotdog fold thioesterase [Syntrophales bacterium]HOS76975.1 hotdog fold thioesterase [Syntrophales bacterium]HPB70160.1 hotdog fold thioesterase [Syntrophales bacterium]